MKNEKFIYIFILVFVSLFTFKPFAFAQSNYVLPYPGVMPGSFSYKIHLIYENFSKYWYFGDFGQFDYNLKMSDKYLVETKILFEYKQYLLGYKALQKSDYYFVNIRPNLERAEKNGRDISEKENMLKKAAQKHIEVLKEMEDNTPTTFLWQPEKIKPTALNLRKALDKSISLRVENL